jgi:hypothetical protein
MDSDRYFIFRLKINNADKVAWVMQNQAKDAFVEAFEKEEAYRKKISISAN